MISIIIPTRNRAILLKKVLDSITKQTYPKDLYEVIVVDNGSTDDTKYVVSSFKSKIPNLCYFFSDIPGLHTGRNLGLENARGDILCYIDDDSFVTKGWLMGVKNAFKDPNVVLVGGPCLPKYESIPPEWVKYLWTRSRCKFGKTLGYLSILDFGDKLIPIPPGYIYGCNFNIRKSILLEFKGFPPDYFPREFQKYSGKGESLVAKKISDSKLLAMYSPEVKIFHIINNNRLTKEYFYKRAYIAGINVSYKKIRDHYYNTKKENRFKMNIILFVKSTIKIIIRIILKPLRKLYHIIFLKEPRDVKKIRKTMRKGWKEGFAFHQNNVKNDPKLLEWVLRENYLGENGKIPEEWIKCNDFEKERKNK